MKQTDIGFVLKRMNLATMTYSFIAKRAGKINLRVYTGKHDMPFAIGTCIGYTLHSGKTARWSTKDTTLVSYPPAQCVSDLYWYHHLMELCHYFIPLDMPCGEIVEYLDMLFCLVSACSDRDAAHIHSLKRLSIVRLLIFFGWYPDKKLYNDVLTFQQMLETSVDFPDSQKVILVAQMMSYVSHVQGPDVETWIMQCIQRHPRARAFKTVRFLPMI